jgi:hypothetical protein
VVVEGHGKVVTDEILARASEIHGVPVFKLIAEALEDVLADLAFSRVGTLLEDILPNSIIEVLSLKAKGAWLLPIEVGAATLKEVGDCVVSHING